MRSNSQGGGGHDLWYFYHKQRKNLSQSASFVDAFNHAPRIGVDPIGGWIGRVPCWHRGPERDGPTMGGRREPARREGHAIRRRAEARIQGRRRVPKGCAGF